MKTKHKALKRYWRAYCLIHTTDYYKSWRKLLRAVRQDRKEVRK